MKNIITVFKKEFYRVMSDKRLIFTAILLPGLAIYLMYSFLGSIISNEIEDQQEHTIIVYEESFPVPVKTFMNQQGVVPTYHELGDRTLDDAKELLLSGEADLIIYFPEDFYDHVQDYENLDTLPDVEIYYNPGEDYSRNAYNTMNWILSEWAQTKGLERFGEDFYVYTVNIELEPGENEVVNEEKAQGQVVANLLPMLIIMFLFSGAMSIGPDSIAGEKERGTIATLLITPIKRSEIAIGKVLSLSVISLFSATSSFTGILLSLPKLMQGAEVDISIYGVREFVILFTVLLATVLFIVGIISVISAYAKTIKEASMLIMPVYFISIFIGVSTMMSGEANPNQMLYLIPIYNSVHVIISILTFEIVPTTFFIMVGSNLVYVAILIYILNKFFQSEKIMFAK